MVHQPLPTRALRMRGIFHMQHVNAHDSRLKNWMRRLQGMATKYLSRYLGWRRLFKRYGDANIPNLHLLEAIRRPSIDRAQNGSALSVRPVSRCQPLQRPRERAGEKVVGGRIDAPSDLMEPPVHCFAEPSRQTSQQNACQWFY